MLLLARMKMSALQLESRVTEITTVILWKIIHSIAIFYKKTPFPLIPLRYTLELPLQTDKRSLGRPASVERFQ